MGQFLRDKGVVGAGHCGLFTFYQREIEYVKEFRFREGHAFFFHELMDLLSVVDGDEGIAKCAYAGQFFRESIFIAEGFAQGGRSAGGIAGVVVVYVGDYAINAAGVSVEVVKAQLKADEDKDEYAAGDTQGESCHIDKGVGSVALKVSPRYFEIILYHVQLVL